MDMANFQSDLEPTAATRIGRVSMARRCHQPRRDRKNLSFIDIKGTATQKLGTNAVVSSEPRTPGEYHPSPEAFEAGTKAVFFRFNRRKPLQTLIARSGGNDQFVWSGRRINLTGFVLRWWAVWFGKFLI